MKTTSISFILTCTVITLAIGTAPVFLLAAGLELINRVRSGRLRGRTLWAVVGFQCVLVIFLTVILR